MIQYRQFRPTGFDCAGLGLEERQDWWVLPCTRNRDSGPLDESNFAAALTILGGEQEDRVEVHRFGHWGNGWFEIILAHPDLKDRAEEIQRRLENYPVLNEEDHSRREQEEYDRAWEDFGRRDFAKALVKKFTLSDEDQEALDEMDSGKLQEFYEELAPQSFVEESGGVTLFPTRAANRCSVDRFVAFVGGRRGDE